MKNFFEKLWSKCQGAWNWLKGEDKDSLEIKEKPFSFYKSLTRRPLMLGFHIWVLLYLFIDGGPLILFIFFTTAVIMIINYLCSKFTQIEHKVINKEDIEAEFLEVDGEPYVLYNTKEYPLLHHEEWELATPIINECNNQRNFIALSNRNDTEKWVYVTEVQRASKNYQDATKALFYISLTFAALGIPCLILAIINKL